MSKDVKKEEEKEAVKIKEMLTENAKNNTKIKYNDRLKVEIVKETKHYKEGQIITPHRTIALFLIEKGIAKEVR